jgi:hypothetical protein
MGLNGVLVRSLCESERKMQVGLHSTRQQMQSLVVTMRKGSTQFRVKIFVFPTCQVIEERRLSVSVSNGKGIIRNNKKGENGHLGVTEVADLKARGRAAIQKRVFQLQVPVTDLLEQNLQLPTWSSARIFLSKKEKHFPFTWLLFSP